MGLSSQTRIIKSNVSFTRAGVQEIKDYFAYFKYRAVFLMLSKYLLERKLTRTPRAKFVSRSITSHHLK